MPIVVTNSSPAGRIRRVRSATSGGGGATPFFADNLAGGVMTNANGFTWGGLGANGSITTEQSVNGGTHSIKIFYPGRATVDSGGEQGGKVEINFSLGRDCTSLWSEHWVYFPANYRHNLRSGSSAALTNMKFINFWNSSYNTTNGRWMVLYQIWADSLLDGAARVDLAYYGRTNLSPLLYKEPKIRFFALDGSSIVKPGEWARFRTQTTRSTSADANDGTAKMWVNNTLVRNQTDMGWWNFYDGAPSPANNALTVGRILGSAENAFLEDTSLYVADFAFYDTNPGW